MRILFLLILIAGCAHGPAAKITRFNGETGRVRQNLWGPIHESKVEPKMNELMAQNCPNGFEIIDSGSENVVVLTGVDAKYYEFKCK